MHVFPWTAGVTILTMQERHLRLGANLHTHYTLQTTEAQQGFTCSAILCLAPLNLAMLSYAVPALLCYAVLSLASLRSASSALPALLRCTLLSSTLPQLSSTPLGLA